MLTSLLFGAAVMAPAAPIPKDTDPAPAGPAPWVLYLKANDNGQVAVTVSKYQTITQPRQVTTTENGQPVTKIVNEQVERLIATYHLLNDMKLAFVTVGGSAVPADAVMKRAKDGIVVLVSADVRAMGRVVVGRRPRQRPGSLGSVVGEHCVVAVGQCRDIREQRDDRLSVGVHRGHVHRDRLILVDASATASR